MKRTAFKTSALLMLLLFTCPLLRAVNTITHTAVYSNSKLTTGTDTLGGVTYSTVNYEGLFNGGAPGTPSLPIDYLKFSVPYNAVNFTVSASLSNNTITPVGYPVYPNQQPRLMSDTTGWSITLPDSSAYQNNVYYPTICAWVVDEGFLAGENHIVTVAVMPVAYRHRLTSYMDQHQLKLSKNVSLTLSYDLSDTLAMYPIVRGDTALRSEGYRLTQSMVVNPANVVTNAPTSMMPDTMIVINMGPGAGGGLRYGIDSTGVYYDTIPINPGVAQMAQYPYLIVTTPELKHAVRRIAALKNQKGLRTKVVTMDEVLSFPYTSQGDLIRQPDGTYAVSYGDDAGKLRQYLKYCYANLGTEYVLLAGMSVPYRCISMKKIEGNNEEINIPSDLYFSDFNGDWYNKLIDYEPELFVGRILAKSQNQISNYTDKNLRYVINPGNGNYSYLRRAFYSQGYDLVCAGEVYIYVKPIFNKLYPYSNVLSESRDINDTSKIPSGEQIIDSINSKQYGFVSLHHHGFPAGLITYGRRDTTKKDNYRFLWAIDSVHILASDMSSIYDDPSNRNGLNNMRNKTYPNICYSTGCTTMPYDILPGYESIPMNFGESFTTGKDYGGPAFIGNTREVWSPCVAQMERLFGNQLDSGFYNIGVANGLAKSHAYEALKSSDSISAKQVPVAQNLLGDPEFEIWTDIPQLFSDITVTRSDSSVVVSGINVASTIVSLCDYANHITKTIVSTDSVTFNHVSPNSSIMLYKHNYIPYIVPMVLQNVALNHSQYVIASDVIAGRSVDSGPTYGNVIVNNGTEYEIEASGTVTLQDGFIVEKGATFAVYPSSF